MRTSAQLLSAGSDQKRVLILSYYHPWVAGGGHRPRRLMSEDLSRGRHVWFICADPSTPLADCAGLAIEEPNRSNLHLGLSISPDRIVCASFDESALSILSAAQLIEHVRPDLVRIHNPCVIHQSMVQLAKSFCALVLYDEMDFWNGFAKQPWGKDTGKWFASNCDVVSCVSSVLASNHSHPDVVVIPNGVTEAFVAACRNAREQMLPKFDVIYAGALWPDWLDWSLIEHTVRELNHLSFAFIGPQLGPRDEDHGTGAELRCQTLASLDNVAMLNEVPHCQLAGLLTSAKVGAIPFKVNPVTVAASPIKVFDYLAADLRIVSSKLPEICGYPGVHCAANLRDFIATIERLVEEPLQPFERDRVRQFVDGSTWRARADELDRLISGVRASWRRRNALARS
jgi:hypothetical protein